MPSTPNADGLTPLASVVSASVAVDRGSVAVQSLKDLDYPLEQCNIHGGAIALGHPIGASGARLALHAAHELKRRGQGKAAVSLCGGGGQGEALLLYRD